MTIGMWVLSVGFFVGLWIGELSHSGANVGGRSLDLLRAFFFFGCIVAAGLSILARNFLHNKAIWKDIWVVVAILQIVSMAGTLTSLFAAINGIELFYRPAFLLMSSFGLGLAFMRLQDEPDARSF